MSLRTALEVALLEAAYLGAGIAAAGPAPCPPPAEAVELASAALIVGGLSCVHPALAILCSLLTGVGLPPSSLHSALEGQAVALAAALGLWERGRQLSAAGVEERWSSSLRFLRLAVPAVVAASALAVLAGGALCPW